MLFLVDLYVRKLDMKSPARLKSTLENSEIYYFSLACKIFKDSLVNSFKKTLFSTFTIKSMLC